MHPTRTALRPLHTPSPHPLPPPAPPTPPRIVPHPVPRMAVGYTCAATAYIGVWTALCSPPVRANMATSPADIGGASGIAVIASALATAMADMPINVIREPRR